MNTNLDTDTMTNMNTDLNIDTMTLTWIMQRGDKTYKLIYIFKVNDPRNLFNLTEFAGD